MKKVQVFEWNKMPYPLGDLFADVRKATNDSYYRYYTSPKANGFGLEPNIRVRMNQWLKEQGLECSGGFPDDDDYFFVLIYVRWSV